MNLSADIARSVNGDGARAPSRTNGRSRVDYSLVETDITDLVQAESRIDALRSLILIFLREVDSLKRVIAPRPRKKGDPLSLDNELDAFEASLIRDALIKSKGNQRDAARLLKIKPTTLSAKMKRLGITVETSVTCVD